MLSSDECFGVLKEFYGYDLARKVPDGALAEFAGAFGSYSAFYAAIEAFHAEDVKGEWPPNTVRQLKKYTTETQKNKRPDGYYWSLFCTLVTNQGWDDAVRCVYFGGPFDNDINNRIQQLLKAASIHVGGPECHNMPGWFAEFYKILYHGGTPAQAYAYAAENTPDEKYFYRTKAEFFDHMPIEKQKSYFPGLKVHCDIENTTLPQGDYCRKSYDKPPWLAESIRLANLEDQTAHCEFMIRTGLERGWPEDRIWKWQQHLMNARIKAVDTAAKWEAMSHDSEAEKLRKIQAAKKIQHYEPKTLMETPPF